MEFQCPKCKKNFMPHRFIAIRHPSKAKCPECGVKGKITVKGKEVRKDIFLSLNQETYGGINEI